MTSGVDGDPGSAGRAQGQASPENTYAEFRLRIERGTAKRSYRIVASGPGGQVDGRFKLPFSDLELENFILKVRGTRTGVRSLESPEMELAKTFGGRLFGALFDDSVRELYRTSTIEAANSGKGLRITLALTSVPELLRVPWEYLYDRPLFPSTDRRTPIVRYLELPKPIKPFQIQLPLRILAIVSAPIDAEPIDAKQEISKLEEALAPLERDGAVAVEWLEDANLASLYRLLSTKDRPKFHILHFIGHGGYISDAKEGVLLFEDKDGRRRPETGDKLGTILHGEESLRLAVLNSCEGARASLNDPFSSVATSLIEHEIPAVIGMQFEITDRAAILFSSEFYAALADGRAVDESVSQARMAIFADNNDIEWGTPVLFMRVTDGRLFDVMPRVDEKAAGALPATAAVLPTEAEVADPPTYPAPPAEPAQPVEPPPPAEPAPPAEPPPPAVDSDPAEAERTRLAAAAVAAAAAADAERARLDLAAATEAERKRVEQAAADTERKRLEAAAAAAEEERRNSEAVAALQQLANAAGSTADAARKAAEANRRRRIGILAAVGGAIGVGLIALFVFLGQPKEGASISLFVHPAGPPNVVKVTGERYQPGEEVSIEINGEFIAITIASDTGAISTTITIPDGTESPVDVRAFGLTSGEQAGASVVIAAAGTASPTAGPTDAPTAGPTASAGATPATPGPTAGGTTAPSGTPVDTPTPTPSVIPPSAPPIATILFYSARIDPTTNTLNADIYEVDPSTGVERRLTDDPRPDSYPARSPDGSRIVFDSRRGDNNQRNIWILEADGTFSSLTDDARDDGYPAWSPDGSQIAWAAGSAPNREIWVMSAFDGSGSRQLTSGSDDILPSWSSAGVIAFERHLGSATEVWSVDPDGGVPIPRIVTADGGGADPAWSPDSGVVALTRRVDGVDRLFIVNADGQSPPVELTGETTCPCEDPAWSPTGEELAYVGPRGSDGARPIMIIPVTGGTPRRVVSNGLSPSWAY